MSTPSESASRGSWVRVPSSPQISTNHCECFVTGRLGRCHRVPVIRVRRFTWDSYGHLFPRRTRRCCEGRSGSTEGELRRRPQCSARSSRTREGHVVRPEASGVCRSNQLSVRTPRMARFRISATEAAKLGTLAPPDSPQGSVRTAKGPISRPVPRRLKAPSAVRVSQIYPRVNVRCVTPLGVLTASTSKRSSSPSSPSQSRSPRPRTMGAIPTCM